MEIYRVEKCIHSEWVVDSNYEERVGNAPDGKGCDDNDPCTTGTTCSGGICKNGTRVCKATPSSPNDCSCQ